MSYRYFILLQTCYKGHTWSSCVTDVQILIPIMLGVRMTTRYLLISGSKEVLCTLHRTTSDAGTYSKLILACILLGSPFRWFLHPTSIFTMRAYFKCKVPFMNNIYRLSYLSDHCYHSEYQGNGSWLGRIMSLSEKTNTSRICYNYCNLHFIYVCVGVGVREYTVL